MMSFLRKSGAVFIMLPSLFQDQAFAYQAFFTFTGNTLQPAWSPPPPRQRDLQTCRPVVSTANLVNILPCTGVIVSVLGSQCLMVDL